ncbi:helix-turn-helix domain-containing protein [Kitasatospora cinereorecta]|uniref:Helix-turn-helix domain-containing protein n=1 Tax=Kitasatospora cinereorecta TaxID=285560 RepID=A0ABW0VAV8_9ACTN
MWTRASAAGVPREDRFDWFTETVSAGVMPVALDTDRGADFHGTVAALDLGPVTMSSVEFSPLRSRRTAAHIRRGDPEEYQLALFQGNAMSYRQLDRDSGPVQGDLLLTNTSLPLHSVTATDGGPIRAVILQIPRAVLPLRAGHVDRLVARRIPATTGLGAILAGFLVNLRDHGPNCRPDELPALGRTVLDLATTCLAQQLGEIDTAPAQARARTLVEEVKVFVEHNLGDRDLTPQAVADRHHLSLRSLYTLFEDEPESVAAFIRTRRLERCRADLARPELRDQSVQTIAARWGFSSATLFGRAFREAYGLTPGEHRRSARDRSAHRLDVARNVENPRTQRGMPRPGDA